MTRSFCIWYNSDANKFRLVDYLMLMFDNFSHVSPQDPECCPKFIKWSNREKVNWKLNSSTLKNWVDLTCAGCVQAGGQQGGLPVVGDAQEQAWHELRDDGQGTQVRDELFSGRNNKQIAMLQYQNIKSVWRRERHFWGAFTMHNSTWFGGMSNNKIDLGPFWV